MNDEVIDSLYAKEVPVSIFENLQERGLELKKIKDNVMFFLFEDISVACYYDGQHFSINCKVGQSDSNYVCWPIFKDLKNYDYHGPYTSLIDHCVDRKSDFQELLLFLTRLRESICS